MRGLAHIGHASLALSLACSHARPVARAPDCAPSWRAVWATDSSVALCVPVDFVSAGNSAWGRAGVGTSFVDFLSVTLLSWPRDAERLPQWPPHIASGSNCLADCATSDSVVVHVDTVAGLAIQTETGLATGGFPGFRRKPVLEAGWILNDTLRGFAQGWSRHGATLDTLRAIMRSIRVVQGRS
jgi:hypothetical protein